MSPRLGCRMHGRLAPIGDGVRLQDLLVGLTAVSANWLWRTLCGSYTESYRPVDSLAGSGVSDLLRSDASATLAISDEHGS